MWIFPPNPLTRSLCGLGNFILTVGLAKDKKEQKRGTAVGGAGGGGEGGSALFYWMYLFIFMFVLFQVMWAHWEGLRLCADDWSGSLRCASSLLLKFDQLFTVDKACGLCAFTAFTFTVWPSVSSAGFSFVYFNFFVLFLHPNFQNHTECFHLWHRDNVNTWKHVTQPIFRKDISLVCFVNSLLILKLKRNFCR